jgi:hypothetical protein
MRQPVPSRIGHSDLQCPRGGGAQGALHLRFDGRNGKIDAAEPIRLIEGPVRCCCP